MAPRKRGGLATRPATARHLRAVDDAEPESRKRAILDAAAEIFHQKGYHGTSIQDIAESVGMLKGSLYYYISSKNELLLQILTDVHEQAFAGIQEVLTPGMSVETRLRRFIVQHAVYCAGHQTGMGVFLHEYKAVQGPARVKVMAMRDLYEVAVREIIRDGQEDGTFRADLDSRLVVWEILGMVNWMYHWYSPDGPLTPQEIGESMADFALRGIEAR